MVTLSQWSSVFPFARCGKKKILLGLVCRDSILGPSQLHFLVAGMLGATAYREGNRGTLLSDRDGHAILAHHGQTDPPDTHALSFGSREF